MSRIFAAGRAGISTSLLIVSVAIVSVAATVPSRSVQLESLPATVSPLVVADTPTDVTSRRAMLSFRAMTQESTVTVSVVRQVARVASRPSTPQRARPAGSSAARLSAARPSLTYLGGASGASNGFFYGYCTWWVAHKRHVPWRGNAAQWWWNARPFGYAEGITPRVGAIMVMGVGPWSPSGHVAYVEEVRPDGSFVVSEMNWGRWGVVDLRTVTSLKGLLGFIY